MEESGERAKRSEGEVYMKKRRWWRERIRRRELVRRRERVIGLYSAVWGQYVIIMIYPSTDTKPTMPQLIGLQAKDKIINIAEAIGDQWRMVGIALLNDDCGTIVEGIGDEFRGKARNINLEILQRWMRGEGIPNRTWGGLLSVLRVHCVSLAESVEEALTEEEAEQGKSRSLYYRPSLPPSYW